MGDSFEAISNAVMETSTSNNIVLTPEVIQGQISASFYIFKFENTGSCCYWDLACRVMSEIGFTSLAHALQIYALEAGVRRSFGDAGSNLSTKTMIKQEVRDLFFLSILYWKSKGFSLKTAARFVSLSTRSKDFEFRASTLEKESSSYAPVMPLSSLPEFGDVDIEAWVKSERDRLGEVEFWNRIGERR